MAKKTITINILPSLTQLVEHHIIIQELGFEPYFTYSF
jgi:hypothetical protein